MSVDEVLRAALQDEGHGAPTWPDPVARVEAGITRRRRRRLAAQAAGLTTALVLVLAVVALQRHSTDLPANGPTIDSSIDEPRSTPPYLQRRSPRPDRAACPIEKLGPIEWIVQSAPWGYSTGFGVRSMVPDRCTLGGTATLLGTDVGTGQRGPVPLAELPPRADGKVRQFPATVDGGELARVEIDGQACRPSQTPHSYRDLVLVFQGHEFPVPDFRNLADVCGARVSPWFVEPPLEYAPLVVSLDAPATIKRGTWFTYTAKVLNPFYRPYRMPACPAYRISPATSQDEWRTLNCQLTEIPAHTTVHFTLHGYMPAELGAGPVKLAWMAAMNDGTVAVSDMQTGGLKVTITE